jgi:methylmalonyl-CoA/ethylmalonyl-CoA epimerase
VTRLGPVYQFAYVVEDIHQAVEEWVTVFGVGPFILLDKVTLDVTIGGVESRPLVSLAFADRGTTQIELVQTHDAHPSAFNSSCATWRGLHHVGIRTVDIAANEALLTSIGYERLQSGRSSTGALTLIMDGGAHRGLVELIQSSDDGAFAERVRAAAAAWDGQSRYG